MKAYIMRNAGAVIYSHGMESCPVTMLDPLAKEFRITHMEMIKGIQGHGYYDELVVPIIENTAHERELTEALAAVIEAYPKTTAVLVRNHGIYVWGDSWISAKTQSECYNYLFEAAIKLHQLGLDWSTPSHGPIQRSNPLLGGQTTNTSQKVGALSLPKLGVLNGSCSRVGGFNPTRTRKFYPNPNPTRTRKSYHTYEPEHDPNFHGLTRTRPV
ncbi:putative class II aldolase/adducin, methylthioribulose-1-phosphate dehydratase [Helianthus annuus]|nr:putative class II aldolase/adducin, methylthioribulose-1-phosphate dehydratase [Helianthus annuus]